MAGSIGTLWARYKTLFIFWGMTLVLILSALGIQWWEKDLLRSIEAVEQHQDCLLRVRVIYPKLLLLPFSFETDQNLLLYVGDHGGNVYTLSLARQDWFSGADGDSAYISTWQDLSHDGFIASLTIPVDGRGGILELIFTGDDRNQAFVCDIALPEISVEDAQHARIRTGLDIFARNVALPLGLLSAIAGWAVSYLAKETDKLEIAFREKMGKLSTEFRADPLYVVEQCLELRRIVSKKSLGRDAEKELNRAVGTLFNRDGTGRLLKQIGEFASRQDSIALMSALASVVSFHKKFSPLLQRESEIDIVFRAVGQVFHYFSEQRNFALLHDLEQPPKTSIGKWKMPSLAQKTVNWARAWQAEKRLKRARSIIEELLQIWDEQDVYSADFVLYGLNRFLDIQSVSGYVKDRIEASQHRRRLKRYKPLTWSDSEPEPYDWPPLIFRDEHFRYPLLYEWLKAPGSVMISNPFEPQPRADTLLLDSAITMQTRLKTIWEQLVSTEPIIFTAKSSSDLISTALLAQNAFQNPARYGLKDICFPIFFEIPATLEGNNWLLALVHRAAEVWLDLLAYSPDAYLDMYPEERRALASWLGWHCGSPVIAVERLRQRLFRVKVGIKDQEKDKRKAQEKEHMGQLLLDFLAGAESTYSKENLPSLEQLLQWLSIRPFGIEKTVAILVAEKIFPPSLSQALADSSPMLSSHGIVLKQFRLEGDVQPERVSVITWSKEALKEILVNRIKLTSGGRESFADLFEKPPLLPDPVSPDYDDQLAEKAQGSLNRLLELGLAILLHHAKHFPDKPYLQEDDFKVIEAL